MFNSLSQGKWHDGNLKGIEDVFLALIFKELMMEFGKKEFSPL